MLTHWSWHRPAVDGAVGLRADIVDEAFCASEIASRGAEALGEGSHGDVNVCGVQTEVVNDTAALGSQSADTMRLVEIEVGLVLLLEADYLRHMRDAALHTTRKTQNKHTHIDRDDDWLISISVSSIDFIFCSLVRRLQSFPEDWHPALRESSTC